MRRSLFVLLLASCAAPPKPVAPVVHRQAPADWFQQQLAAARQARASHQPPGDTEGAQRAYDTVARAACARVALSGPEKYQARCAAILRPGPAEPFACDDGSTDPSDLQACND